jgi:hypothetical protein
MTIYNNSDASPAVKVLGIMVDKCMETKSIVSLKPGTESAKIFVGEELFMELPIKLYKNIVLSAKVEMGFDPQKYKNELAGGIKINNGEDVFWCKCFIGQLDKELILNCA